MPSPTPAPRRSAARKARAFEGGWRVPGIMWWPGHIPAGAYYDEMMSHMDVLADDSPRWSASPRRRTAHGSATTASRSTSTASTTAPTSSGKAQHSARRLVDLHRRRELHGSARATSAAIPNNPDLNIAWKYLWTAKDTWLGPEQNLGAHRRGLQPHHGPVREIRHDVQRRDVVSPAHRPRRASMRARTTAGSWR